MSLQAFWCLYGVEMVTGVARHFSEGGLCPCVPPMWPFHKSISNNTPPSVSLHISIVPTKSHTSPVLFFKEMYLHAPSAGWEDVSDDHKKESSLFISLLISTLLVFHVAMAQASGSASTSASVTDWTTLRHQCPDNRAVAWSLDERERQKEREMVCVRGREGEIERQRKSVCKTEREREKTGPVNSKQVLTENFTMTIPHSPHFNLYMNGIPVETVTIETIMYSHVSLIWHERDTMQATQTYTT